MAQSLVTLTKDDAGNTILTLNNPTMLPNGLPLLAVTIGPNAEGAGIDQPTADRLITDIVYGGQ